MFIRQMRNKSGSFGIQILLKENGRNILLKTIRSSSDPKELIILKEKAKQEDDRFKGRVSLFVFEKDVQNESFI
jgi:hypothetical protein